MIPKEQSLTKQTPKEQTRHNQTKPIVIKVGGALLESPDTAHSFFNVIATLKQTLPVVLVHGGGNSVAALLSALNFESTKLNGLRVTPPEQLPYVVGALAGTVNKTLCSWAMQAGMSAVGLSLFDGGMCQGEPLGDDYGAVGKVQAKQSELLDSVLNLQHLPVISSIAADASGGLLNINADDAAAAIAELIQGELVLLSDVPCVLDAKKAPIPSLTQTQINTLIEQNVIEGGMAVKVRAAVATANQINSVVRIASWKTPQQLLGLLAGEAVGTAVLPDGANESLMRN